MKTLVLYFSVSGNTRRMAEAIARATGADLAEIRTATPLESTEDINRQLQGKAPFKFLSLEKNPSDYDLIFFGTPVWAFNPAAPIKVFLKEAKIQKKKVAAFYTYQLFPGFSRWSLGQALRGNRILGMTALKNGTPENEAEAWAKGIIEKA